MKSRLGPGLPIAETVRFVTIAGALCRRAFEALGQRAQQSDDATDRVDVGIVARHFGNTIDIWGSLAPDAVGLRALEADVAEAAPDSAAWTPVEAALNGGPLRASASGLVHGLRQAVKTVQAQLANVADQNVELGLAHIENHLRKAADALAAPSTDANSGSDTPTDQSLAVAVVRYLFDDRKDFSFSLSVPKN